MIYKSFLRKNTTKIYIFIIVLLFTVLGFLMIIRNNYRAINNKNYEGSYISIKSNKDIMNDLKKKSYIKSIKRAIYYNELYLTFDNELAEDEIIIPKFYAADYPFNSIVEINLKNNYKFKIKKYDDKTDIIYINNNILNAMLEETDEYVYLLDLKDWIKSDKIGQSLSREYESVTNYIKKNENIDYSEIMLFINAFILTNISLFLIILLITILNVLADEKKKTKIYHALGFNKSKIALSNVFKILLLLLISTIISTILVIVGNVIFITK